MKTILASVALLFAIVLATVNMFMPPQGEIDGSVVNIFAQLLIFAATLLGVDAVVLKRLGRK